MTASASPPPNAKSAKRKKDEPAAPGRPIPWWGRAKWIKGVIAAVAAAVISILAVVNRADSGAADVNAAPPLPGIPSTAPVPSVLPSAAPASAVAAGPALIRLTADNAKPDGKMPPQDGIFRMHDTPLAPDQFAVIGVRNDRDTKNGTNLYFCGAVDKDDIVCPNVVLGASRAAKGPWRVMAMVVDPAGKAIIDDLHGRPFLPSPQEILGAHLLRYGAIPLSR